MFSRSSDDQFVGQIERELKLRKLYGIPFLLLGLVSLIGAGFGFDYVKTEALKAINQFSCGGDGGEVFSNTVAFSVGFKMGLLVLGLAMSGAHLLGLSIRFLFGMRKERLLLKHYGKSKNR